MGILPSHLDKNLQTFFNVVHSNPTVYTDTCYHDTYIKKLNTMGDINTIGKRICVLTFFYFSQFITWLSEESDPKSGFFWKTI